MRTHTQKFKNEIKELGKQITSRISYDGFTLTDEDLWMVQPIIKTDLLKSVMKGLSFQSNIKIDKNSAVKYELGLLVDNEYEYIDFGNYIVYSSEYNEDTKSYEHTCYDSMLFSMKEYKTLQSASILGKTFPMSVRDYITCLCADIGLVFKNANDTFANYDKIINSDLYANLGYTYRDIFDELSQVTASNICIDLNDMVEVRYINDTNDTIDEEYLKDINVKFGEKYGPINSIVLSRSAESDNVYLQNEQSVATNGLCEIKISDNQIMNNNDRSDYLPSILAKLNGLEYYLNDFTSTGILYYELCDKYNVKIGENTYSCVLFNDEPKITQGLVENIYTERPEESVTDYTKADKTDRRINQTYLIVDKQNQTINLLASKQIDTSNEVNKIGLATLENCMDTELYRLSIKGDITRQYYVVNQDNSTYPVYLDTYLIVESGEHKDRYNLPIDYLTHLGNVYDEFLIENGQAKLIKRIGIVDNQRQVLAEPIETDLGAINIKLYEGTNTIYLESFSNVQLGAKYLIQNPYTKEFAKQVDLQAEINVRAEEVQMLAKAQSDTNTELQSEIKTRAEEVQILSKEKVGNDEIIAKINVSPETVKVNANKIELSANDILNLLAGNSINLTSKNITISSDNFTVDQLGNMVCNNAKITGGLIKLTSTESNPNFIIDDSYGNRMNLIGNSLIFQNDDSGKFSIYDRLGFGLFDTGSEIQAHTGTANYFSFRQGAKSTVYLADNYGSDGNSVLKLTSKNSDDKYIRIMDDSITLYDNNVNNITMKSNGSIQCVELAQTSLEKNKKNFEKYDGNALDEIHKIDIYKYNLKSEDDAHKKHLGFVIGDNYNYSHEITAVNEDGEEIGVDNYSMTSLCLQAIKEQEEQIKLLKQEIELLKNKESDINEKDTIPECDTDCTSDSNN